MAQGRSPPKSPHRTPSRTHAAEGCTRASRAAARDSRSHTQPQRHSRSRTQPQAHFTGSLSSSSSPRSLLENLSYREADEESNIQWIERRRGRNGNEESNEHTRRMLRRRSEFEEEEEGIKKETLASRICRAAKVVSGFLISMGLVLVVSRTDILDRHLFPASWALSASPGAQGRALLRPVLGPGQEDPTKDIPGHKIGIEMR
nr:uncharacterized protein LOC113828201 [Penaeus vannamei]